MSNILPLQPVLMYLILLLYQGNCLLVGVGGSGKQSLSRIAAFTSGCEVFEITLSRGYDETSLRDDLKKLYTMLGAEDKKVRIESFQHALFCFH